MAESAILSESSVLISYPNGLGFSHIVPTKKYSLFDHIMNPLLTKPGRSRWLNIVLFFCVVIDHDFDLVHENAKRNLANI